jgi:hypothetical protein
MKKSISIFVFVLLLSGTAWSQASAPSGSVWPQSGGDDIGTTILPDGPKSVASAFSAELFSSDVDNFLSLTDYGTLAFNKLYLFLGGATSGALTGGAATKIGGNYLAFYTAGDFFPESGSASKPEGDVANDSDKYEDSTFRWNNTFSVLWGNAVVGGLRFDFQFSDDSANNNYTEKKGITQTKNQAFVTALRWSGLKFGGFSLAPTVAFQWPGYTKQVTDADTGGADDTEETWENAALDVKLEAAYGNFGADYEILVNFGTTKKGDFNSKDYEEIHSGHAVHTLGLNYTATYDADEKIQFKAKPTITMNLYTKADTSEITYTGGSVDTDNGTETAFRLIPTIDLGVSWKLLPKLTLYTGTTVTPFTLTTSSTTEGDDSGDDGKESYLEGASVNQLYLGLEFNPAPALGIEFGITNSYANLSGGNSNLNLVNYSGRFLVKVKL